MGIFRDRQPRGSRVYNAGNHQQSMIPRYTSPPDRNTREWLEAFGKNPRMAVVDRIASDLSFLSGKLYRVDKNGEEKELISHPFLDFWDNPNPLHEMSSSALWRLQQLYLDLKGEGYFVIERDYLGRPVELWPVPTHWVHMIPYLGYPYYTVRVATGAVLTVPVEDMFVMRELNPLDPYRRGLGKAEPLADEIETDEYAAKFQKKFFYNDATPNILISMPGSTEPQRKRFMSEWRERLQGVFKSHGVATINGDVKVEKLGDSMKDLDMTNGRTFLRDAVLEHFGIPREIMGITESSNRATSEAAQFIYAQNVLTPRKNLREDAINKQLLPYFGDDLVWRYDEIVPRNQEFDKQKGIEGWNSGLLTRDEARDLLDLPPAKNGGNVYKTQFSDVFVAEGDDPAAVSTEMARLQFEDGYSSDEGAADPDEGDGDDDVLQIDVVDLNPPQKRIRPRRELKSQRVQGLQNTLEAARKRQERRFELTTVKFFADQQKRIQDALGSREKADGGIWDVIKDYIPTYDLQNGSFVALDQEEIDRLASDFVLKMIDWEGEQKIMETLFEPMWRETYDEGAKAARLAYGMNVDRPQLVNFENLKVHDRIKGIQETTAESIERIIGEGIKTGGSRQSITEAIMQEMNTGAGRAGVIAQTETHTCLMSGNMDMMKVGGIKEKTWLTARDASVRDRHKKLHGVTVPIDGYFDTGKNLMRFPGDPECGDPGEIANCRCDLIAGDY